LAAGIVVLMLSPAMGRQAYVDLIAYW
jgi:hypothetical protein